MADVPFDGVGRKVLIPRPEAGIAIRRLSRLYIRLAHSRCGKANIIGAGLVSRVQPTDEIDLLSASTRARFSVIRLTFHTTYWLRLAQSTS